MILNVKREKQQRDDDTLEQRKEDLRLTKAKN